MNKILTSSAIAALLAAAGPVIAQDSWPAGPVTLVVPYNPGGTTDNMVRIIAAKMEEALGSSVVVTNTSGGGGVVGMSAALQAAPDGQTVGLYITNTLVSMVTGGAPFTMEEIQPACMFGDAVLTITGIGGDNALDDLAALVDVDGASIGIERGTLSQFAGLQFNEQAGGHLNVVHAGDGPARNAAVMGGHITALITPTAGVIQQHEAGQLKILAVLSEERLSVAPDLPTAREQGFDVTLTQSNGFMFPAGTPQEAVDGLCDVLETITADPGFIAEMEALNVDVRFMRGEAYQEYMTGLMTDLEALTASAGYGD